MTPPRHITAADGVRLRHRSWLATEPCAQVLLLHGFAEHGDRYAAVAKTLAAEHALSVLNVDFRGHGESEGLRGFVNRFEDYHLDVDALLAQARADDPSLPIVLLAHSMGGLVATDYLQTRGGPATGIRAVALSSPYFGLRRPLRWLARTFVGSLSAIVPRLALPARLPGAMLCTDPAIAADHDRDPLIFSFARSRWIRESLRAHQRVLSRAPEVRLPTLVLYGTDDCIASPEATRRLVAEFPDCEAEAVDEKHEILNAAEPRGSRIVARIGEWLADAARPAGPRSAQPATP